MSLRIGREASWELTHPTAGFSGLFFERDFSLISYIKKHPAVTVTIVAALLYLSGLMYYVAYLDHLGIEESQFTFPVDRTMFHGFIALIMKGLNPLLYVLAGLMVAWILLVLLVAIIRFFLRYVLIERKERKTHEVADGEDWAWFIGLLNGFEILNYTFLVLLLLVAIMLTSASYGEESAQVFIEKCGMDDFDVTHIFISDASQPMRGCSIVCNANACAYLWESETFVVRDGVVVSRRALPEQSE